LGYLSRLQFHLLFPRIEGVKQKLDFHSNNQKGRENDDLRESVIILLHFNVKDGFLYVLLTPLILLDLSCSLFLRAQGLSPFSSCSDRTPHLRCWFLGPILFSRSRILPQSSWPVFSSSLFSTASQPVSVGFPDG
jgi:hypothetical protein